MTARQKIAIVLGLVGALPTPVALADVGGITVKWDKRSRMQTVVPRQRTDVRMLAEDVRLIPYFDPRFPEEPMMLVDALGVRKVIAEAQAASRW